MRFSVTLSAVALMAALCLTAQGQPPANPDVQIGVEGEMPPRAAPTDYEAHTKVGAFTLAAEFKGHFMPTLDKVLNNPEYVAVEVGLFGTPGSHLALSFQNFSLRINGKKSPLPGQSVVLVVGTLKDPEWQPPASEESKSKTQMGGGAEIGSTPPPVKIPFPLQRAMAQSLKQVTLAEGDRPLPQAGLLFFEYRGKADGIHSVELIYNGPAGKGALKLHP
jgi:hypothetical protein